MGNELCFLMDFIYVGPRRFAQAKPEYWCCWMHIDPDYVELRSGWIVGSMARKYAVWDRDRIVLCERL